MKIQIIGNNHKIIEDSNIRLSTMQEPLALDSFDINVINLGLESLWKNNEGRLDVINEQNDLQSISTMIQNANAPVIIALPQNYTFQYHYSHPSFRKHKKLKDMLSDLWKVVSVLIPGIANSLLFENNVTIIDNNSYVSAFCFMDYYFQDSNIITKSNMSDKPTTVRINDKIILTTLDICENNELFNGFITEVWQKSQKHEVAPPWLNDVVFYNDQDVKKIIDVQKTIISNAERTIQETEKQLEHNIHFKSILYTNGEELVKVIYEILEDILSCNLSEFVDLKKEDFLIKLQNVTFIGEIKGISSNVKNGNVSQLDVHLQDYKDELNEKGLNEELKALLIINPLRFLPPSDRDPVNESQINLAKRNGSLIIETMTLLKLYEKYLNQEMTPADIIDLFKENIGLLEL